MKKNQSVPDQDHPQVQLEDPEDQENLGLTVEQDNLEKEVMIIFTEDLSNQGHGHTVAHLNLGSQNHHQPI